MDSKEEMTLSQKIVTDAVLRKNDDEKLEWLSRRYKEQGKIDQSFEKIFSSIPSTEELLIKKTKLLANLDIENSDIVEEIQSLITTVDVAKKYNILFDMIKYVKNSTQRLNLIKAVDSRMSSSNGFMYNLEETKDYCYALSETVATFKKTEEIVQFLNLNVLNPKVIASVISGMIPFMTDLEVISKYPEISKTINIDIKKWDAIYETEDDIINEIGTSLNVDLAIEQLKETLKIEDEFDDEFDIDEFLMYSIIDILPEEVRPVAMKDLYATINESEMRERLNGINQYLPAATAEILNKLISPLTKYTIPDIVEKEYRRGVLLTLSSYSLTEEGLIKTLVEKKINLNLLRLDSELKDANNERIDVEKLVSYFNSREDAITTIITYASFQRYDAPHLLDLSNAKENMYQFIYNNIVRSSMSIDEIKALPEEFKQEHSDLKKLCSLPSDLEEILYWRSSEKYYEELLRHSELIKILADSNINLKFIFPALSGDIEKISNQFDSREDAIKAISVYCWALYIQRIGDREIPQIDFEKENSKEEIYQKIHEGFLHNGCPYIESMPEDFKREHPDLFLGKDVPEELRTLICKKHFNGDSLFNHPEWLDILANQKLDLNLLNNFIFNKNRMKVDSNEFVNKFENKKTGLFVLLNYQGLERYYYNKIDPDETKPEVMVALAVKYNLYKMYPLFSTPFPFTDLLTDEVLESMLGFKDEQDKQIDVKRVINEFGSREEIAKIWVIYDQMFRNKANGRIDPNNIKESIYQNIHEFIMNGGKYSEDMPEDFKEKYSDLFLSQNAPEVLKVKVYGKKYDTWSGGINKDIYAAIYKNPEWVDILVKENFNLNVLFKLYDKKDKLIDANVLAEQFDSKEVAIKTFVMYTAVCKNNNGNDIDIENPKESIYPIIYEEILEGSRYFEDMPEDFKKEHSELFLDKTIPEDIRTKFYQKQFTLKDFEENPNLVKTFGNANLLLGLNDDKYQFLITLFKGPDANNDRLKAIEIFNESTNEEEAEFIRNSIIESREAIGTIKIEKFPDLIELHKNVQYSNAVELSSFKENYMREILNSDNPIATFKSLENIYLKGDLPGYAKLFKCFKTIYPTFEKAPDVHSKSPGFNFTLGSRISPELLEAGDAEHRFLIVYNDLLRIAIHSQDSSLVECLDNIDKGSELYFALCKKEKTIETISNEEVEELTTFASHLESIYEGISFPYQDELKELTPEQNNSVKKFKLLNRMSAKDYFKDRNDLVQIDKLEKYKRAMLKTKISILLKKFNASTIESADNLKDKIVSYIGHSAGYDSFNQMVEDINKIRNETDKRNRKRAEEYRNKPFMFEEGDFLRCIGGIKALTGSINKGNVSKEFMCSYTGTSGSDTTPLDVDITYMYPKSGITTSIDGGTTGWGFGNVFVVIKKDNPNLNITRDSGGNLLESEYDVNKIETFGTKTIQGGTGIHWGARTGITFTDIDFILYKETKIIERNADGLPQVDENGDIVYVKDSIQNPNGEWVPIVHDALAEIQFEIARNGYYIPVFDMLGRLSFTPEQYDELRSKMCGLPHYTSEEYHISNKLDFPGIDELIEIKKADMKKTAVREKLIREKIKEIMKTSKLKVDTIAVTDTLSTDLTEGIVQLIGTGSTSRGTNVPDDSDFDYMLKVDKKVVQTGMDELISSLKNIKHDEDNSHDNRVKLVGVTIDGLDIKIDTDISIAQKQNDITYSTEMALEERLETIRKQSQSAYEKVIANIVYAKQFLKEIGTYKHARVDKTSGGLGGVGVENWILQNGGSFRQACETFMDKAIDHETGQIVPFEKFRKTYTIWDFGENHESKGQHPFDEYVSLNMNEAGYNKLVKELPKKIKEINEGLSRNRTIESTAPIIEEEIIEEEPLEASVGFGR